MKNPDSKPLRIVRVERDPISYNLADSYGIMLSNLAIAQSNLMRAGKDSAQPHFIAIIKELERLYGFKFEIIEDANT